MDSRITRFFDEMKGKKIAFCGIGISNLPLVSLFSKKGAVVTVCDRRKAEDLPEGDMLKSSGAIIKTGEGYLDDLDVDIIFRTPGMYYHMEQLTEYRKKGVIVTSEMEVFFDLCPCKTIAVTGSDGKTTTTTLIAEMLREEGKTVHKGGNIGRALLPMIEEIKPADYAVVELSSFQLISMRKSPDVAVITNVAPNLDVHKTMEEYTEAKLNLIQHQTAFSAAVLNRDNAVTCSMQELVRGELKLFSMKNEVYNGAFCDSAGDLYLARKGINTKIINKKEIRLPGEHNVENYLAAISAVTGYVSLKSIVTVAKNFGGVEHRIEFIRELDGVKYYNDSIATSPTRTIAGLKSFPQKIIIIAGGYDKHIPFEPLADVVNEKVKLMVLTGPTASKIEKVVTGYKDYNPESLQILHAENLPEAVKLCREHANNGDIVSLSPACASFDSYPNFEARGRHFKELVNAL